MPFDATFESLTTFECPDWFRDAKFGIWSHWGPQSVPRYGDWYARHMYRQDTDQYRYHLRTYGHPSTVGYKDVVRQWKAERFDPDGLMERFVAAGARYFVAQAVHHDNFFNYESSLNRWNSVKVGPGKDIVGLWKAAADERGIPFGITEHLGAAFSWMAVNKGSTSTVRSPAFRTTEPIPQTWTCTSTTAGTCPRRTSRFRTRGTSTIPSGTATGSRR